MKKYKKYLFPALIAAFAIIFLVSAGFLIDYFVDSKKQADQYDDLADLMNQGQQGQLSDQEINDYLDDYYWSDSEYNPEDDGSLNTPELPDHDPSLPEFYTIRNPDTGELMDVLREFALLFPKNTDLAGWITVEGTDVNYPVLQSPDRPNYYLTRNFYKENSRHGAIYANETADLDYPSDNVTLYGHKMQDGSMFASLHKYKDPNFFKEHPYITFNTLTERHTYKIISVFTTCADPGKGFAYHAFVDGDAQTFADFVAECKRLSLYDTRVEAIYGDKLLTLSTCEHSINNGRFVVVAKRVS